MANDFRPLSKEAQPYATKRSAAEEAEELANTAAEIIADQPKAYEEAEARVEEEAYLAVTGAKSPEESPYAATGAMHQVIGNRVADAKARDERNAELIRISEMVRRRIAELDQLIEKLTQENKELTREIVESRQRQERLHQAERGRDFSRDPQTGEFTNEDVERAVREYEKRFGPVERDDPGLLIIVMQWAQDQERGIQADKQNQVKDNNRKIDDAESEQKGLSGKLESESETKHNEVAKLVDEKAKAETLVSEFEMKEEEAAQLGAMDNLFTEPAIERKVLGGDELDFLEESTPAHAASDIEFLTATDDGGDLNFLDDQPTAHLDADSDLDFLAQDTSADTRKLTSATTGQRTLLDLEEGNIKAPVDLQTSFSDAVAYAAVDTAVSNEMERHEPRTSIASTLTANQNVLG